MSDAMVKRAEARPAAACRELLQLCGGICGSPVLLELLPCCERLGAAGVQSPGAQGTQPPWTRVCNGLCAIDS